MTGRGEEQPGESPKRPSQLPSLIKDEIEVPRSPGERVNCTFLLRKRMQT